MCQQVIVLSCFIKYRIHMSQTIAPILEKKKRKKILLFGIN